MTDAVESALWRWQHARPDAPGLTVEAIEFTAIPGWEADDHREAFDCYTQSAHLTGQPLPQADSAGDPWDRMQARRFFEETFAAFRVSAAPGLLTSYFEPVLKGSRKRSAAFSVPVYRRPPDLRPLPQGHRLTVQGLTAGRETSDGFEPYCTREAIEAGALAGRGLELLYIADPVEAFVMHIQGSGFVELDDGSAVRLTFDGKNGHSYTSISKLLVERGFLSRENAHLEGTLAWLRAQRDVQKHLNENRSYIFFRELENSASAPKGSCGTPLCRGRSLATNPFYHAFGTPIWVSARDLIFDGRPFRRLLIAQDTGSAIVGPQRGDVFAGTRRAGW